MFCLKGSCLETLEHPYQKHIVECLHHFSYTSHLDLFLHQAYQQDHHRCFCLLIEILDLKKEEI